MTPAFTRGFWQRLAGLSPKETEWLQRLEDEPSGTSYLGAASVLRSRGMTGETIVLLEEGLGRFPAHHSLRLALGKELLHKGLLREAAGTLEPLLAWDQDNAPALQLVLKTCIYLQEKDKAAEILGRLRRLRGDDAITAWIRQAVEVDDWNSARECVLADFKKLGVELSKTPTMVHLESISRLAHVAPDAPWQLPSLTPLPQRPAPEEAPPPLTGATRPTSWFQPLGPSPAKTEGPEARRLASLRRWLRNLDALQAGA